MLLTLFRERNIVQLAAQFIDFWVVFTIGEKYHAEPHLVDVEELRYL